MRTGSTSLTRQLLRVFGEEAVYPNSRHDRDGIANALSVTRLVEQWAVRSGELRVIAGHFPLRVAELLGAQFRTLTVLRHPVERTLSQLRQYQHSVPEFRGASLETIYADRRRYDRIVHNHSMKLFALTTAEVLPHGLRTRVDFTRDRFEQAKEQLASVDVIGLQEDYDRFTQDLSHRFGWNLDESERANVTNRTAVHSPLRERIAEDNALDMEFYAFAQELLKRRSSSYREPR